LTKHAQKVLNNKLVRITFDDKIVVEEKSKKLYLAKDKFNYYNEQNKALSLLVNAFSLEI
jgi:hypothetical protein